MEKSRVIPVTSAKPFLDEKLRRMSLQLANMQDCAEKAVSERASRRALLLKDSADLSHKDLEKLRKEFKRLFRDFSGYEAPPVLPELPIFDEFQESEKVKATEDQYVLGSLTLEEGEANHAIEWCLKIHHLGLSLEQMHETAEELKKETTLKEWEMELNQKEKNLEEQESRIKKLLDKREAALNHREKILEETLKKRENLLEKTMQQRENLLEETMQQRENIFEDGKIHQALIQAEIKKEQEKRNQQEAKLEELQLRLDKRESHTEQLREGLPEQRVNLRGQEDRLRQRESEIKNQEQELAQQQKKYQRLCDQMEQHVDGKQPFVDKTQQADPNDIFASIPDDTEGESQAEFLNFMQQERQRLDQDKNWVKSLLKTLLEQQEKIQTVQENVREAERSSIRNQTDNLRQEKGWIKVEKNKIRKAGILDEDIEINME